MLLFENDFVHIEYQSGIGAIIMRWSEKTHFLKPEQYKSIIKTWIENIENQNAKLLMINTETHTFNISLELQQWFAEEILPEYERLGINKLAFVVSHDIFTQASIEQAMDEAQQQSYQSQYFDKETDAVEWLQKH